MIFIPQPLEPSRSDRCGRLHCGFRIDGIRLMKIFAEENIPEFVVPDSRIFFLCLCVSCSSHPPPRNSASARLPFSASFSLSFRIPHWKCLRVSPPRLSFPKSEMGGPDCRAFEFNCHPAVSLCGLQSAENETWFLISIALSEEYQDTYLMETMARVLN